MRKYEKLCTMLRVESHLHHALKIALTHYGYQEENEATTENGSRYIFYGQTVFKAEVAKILFEYVAGTGMQLQQYWGNLFKPEKLLLVFEKYKLAETVRYSSTLDIATHKHIFTWGLLGFMHQFAEPDVLQHFIYKNFLENSEHLMPESKIYKNNYQYQTLFLCKLYYNAKPNIKIQAIGDKYVAKIEISNKIIAEVASSSYKYARQKAWKTALRSIAEHQEQKLLQNPEFISKEQERKEKLALEKETKRQANIQANEAKQALRSQVSQEKKVAREKAASERDRNRRDAKQAAKERKELAAKQNRIKQMGLENISAAKRRILEDKGILPKKK